MEQFFQRCIDGLKGVKMIRESRIGGFLISVLAELQKVTWPTRVDVKNSTIVTVVVMVLMALFMGGAASLVEFLYDQVKGLVA